MGVNKDPKHMVHIYVDKELVSKVHASKQIETLYELEQKHKIIRHEMHWHGHILQIFLVTEKE